MGDTGTQDIVLIRRCRAGSRRAFEGIVKKYMANLSGFGHVDYLDAVGLSQ